MKQIMVYLVGKCLWVIFDHFSGHFWAILGQFWAILGQFWSILGQFWAIIGPILGRTGVGIWN